MLDESELFKRACSYAKSRGQSVAESERLGHGSDGTVWHSSANSAIKAVYRPGNYEVERTCYQRLSAAGVTKLGGFTIPALLGFDDELLVIEMDIVSAPYVLDFAKAYLDYPPVYWNDSQMRRNIYEEWRERFDDHWEDVACVLQMLTRFDIYYVDPRPGNIDATGLP